MGRARSPRMETHPFPESPMPYPQVARPGTHIDRHPALQFIPGRGWGWGCARDRLWSQPSWFSMSISFLI